ncbi:MAG: (2Fe-2S) ferredoxin domain-containing protein [Anaerolineae bacterium]|nr:(2Fe-2S) ferredoxin domain-containing protein [Anaerolineae bacterium]
MGSACHQYGVYDVLPVLQRLLAERAPDSQVALKGAFCLGPCMDGIILKLGDVTIVHVNAKNIEQKFEDEILPYLTREKN